MQRHFALLATLHGSSLQHSPYMLGAEACLLCHLFNLLLLLLLVAFNFLCQQLVLLSGLHLL
jgi:hypothetical protein